jgi:CheY-like chemotaxis protein
MFYIKARRCVDEPKSRQTSFSDPTATRPVILPHTASEARRANVSQGSVHTLSSPSQATIPPQDIHILIVEDNAINQRVSSSSLTLTYNVLMVTLQVMSQQLRKLGCIVHTADHGQDCIDFLQKTVFTSNSENIPLSIILMDLEVSLSSFISYLAYKY